MNYSKGSIPIKILVTGSRGKSSLVRLLHSAFVSCGVRAYSRITGVLPRELSPTGEPPILRSAGAHVEEMRWWIRSIPADAEAIVMENSAVAPALQPLAARWMRPDIVVLTNVRPDHQAAWGPGEENAARALIGGIPSGTRVVLSAEAADRDFVREVLRSKKCEFSVPSLPAGGGEKGYLEENIALALETCKFAGLSARKAEEAMRDLEADIADFCVLRISGAKLAFAFSANDVDSTRELFTSLGWRMEETRLIYNHRGDRPDRLRAFRKWISSTKWRESIIIGDRPLRIPGNSRYVDIKNAQELIAMFKRDDRIFGCGNTVYGVPLHLRALAGKEEKDDA